MKHVPLIVTVLALGAIAVLVGQIKADLTVPHDHADVDELVSSLAPVDVIRNGIVVVGIISPHESRLLRQFYEDLSSLSEPERSHVTAVSLASEHLPMGDGVSLTYRHLVSDGSTLRKALREIDGFGQSRWAVFRSGDVTEAGYIRNGGITGAVEAATRRSSAKDALTAAITRLVKAGDLPTSRVDGIQLLLIATEISHGCPASRVIRDLDDHLAALSGRIQVAVTSDWSPAEVGAVRKAMGTRLSFTTLSDEATSTWRALVRNYGTVLGGGALIVIDQDEVQIETDPAQMTARVRELL